MEFILDGTNLLRSLQNHSSLGIILHLASDMLERGEDFVCYYDHTTVNKHDFDPIALGIYQQITLRADNPAGVLFCDGHFREIWGKNPEGEYLKADDAILNDARRFPASRIISFDTYRDEEYGSRYGWTSADRKMRLLTVYIHEGVIRLVQGDDTAVREIPIQELDIETLALNLINRIEASRGRLVGRVEQVKAQNQIGYIRRRYNTETNNRRIAFRPKDLADPPMDFINATGVEVGFRIQSRRGRDDKLVFHAAEVKPIVGLEQENQVLKEEIERLKSRVLELETELAALSDSRRVVVGKLEAEEAEKQDLLLTVGVLEEQVEALQSHLTQARLSLTESGETQQIRMAMEELQQENEDLVDRLNRDRARWSVFSQYNGSSLIDASQAFEALQREMDSLRQENQQLRLQLDHLREQPFDGNVVPEEAPENPIVNQDKQALLQWWRSLSDTWRKAFAISQHLDIDKPNLLVLQAILDSHELSLFGQHPFMPGTLPFKLSDLSGITQLRTLETLNLSFNQIEDLSVLSKLERLKRIVLISNQVRSLEPLETLPALQYVQVSDCPISGGEATRFQEANPEVELVYE